MEIERKIGDRQETEAAYKVRLQKEKELLALRGRTW